MRVGVVVWISLCVTLGLYNHVSQLRYIHVHCTCTCRYWYAVGRTTATNISWWGRQASYPWTYVLSSSQQTCTCTCIYVHCVLASTYMYALRLILRCVYADTSHHIWCDHGARSTHHLYESVWSVERTDPVEGVHCQLSNHFQQTLCGW